MQFCQRMLFMSILIASAFQISESKTCLELQNTIYLRNGLDQFEFDSETVTSIAYDEDRKLIFAVGKCSIYVINAETPGALTLLLTESIKCDELSYTDVTLCGDLISTTYNELKAGGMSFITSFVYSPTPNTLRIVVGTRVSSKATSISPASKNCRTLSVASENGAFATNTSIVDPQGRIDLFRNIRPTLFNFVPQDSDVLSLLIKGVRFVYKDTVFKPSEDLEPKDIIFNSNFTRAFVLLQKNNALAVLNVENLRTITLIDIIPFKTKLWASSALDASQSDNDIKVKPADVLGLLQPGDLKLLMHAGEEYLVASNEGRTTEIKRESELLFKDFKTGEELVNEGLVNDSVSLELKAALADRTQLGQLQFSTVDGLDESNGKYERFFAFGGRSFSLIRTRDMEMVFESGSSLETTIAAKYPLFFNTRPVGDKRPDEILENRSFLRGPEPGSIEVGQAYGKSLIFVGSKNPGTISIYSLANDSVIPEFESVFFGADVRAGETWNTVYNERRTGDLNPTNLIFVPSANDEDPPLLYVAGSISGTVSCYKVLMKDDMPVTPKPKYPRKKYTKRPRGRYYPRSHYNRYYPRSHNNRYYQRRMHPTPHYRK